MGWRPQIHNFSTQTWEVIYDFGAVVDISTPTPLLALTELGKDFEQLKFIAHNIPTGGTSADIFLQVDHAMVGATFIDNQPYMAKASINQSCSVPVLNVPSLWWGVTAFSDPDAGYPAQKVTWQIIGRRRIP